MATPKTNAAEVASPSDALLAQIAALQAENDKLKSRVAMTAPSITLKPGKSGGLSLYGMGRYPITLYPAQWENILCEAELIRTAIEVGTSIEAFAVKGQKVSRGDEELDLIRGAFASGLNEALAK